MDVSCIFIPGLYTATILLECSPIKNKHDQIPTEIFWSRSSGIVLCHESYFLIKKSDDCESR